MAVKARGGLGGWGFGGLSRGEGGGRVLLRRRAVVLCWGSDCKGIEGEGEGAVGDGYFGIRRWAYLHLHDNWLVHKLALEAGVWMAELFV